jgi:three-Cys-motif partner protein
VSSETDSIGPWSEVKLEILQKYLSPYSLIVSNYGFYHLYIDAFAAGGSHISRETAEIVRGSPLIALDTEPSFREYHFIDKDPEQVEKLSARTPGRADVHIHQGDCNDILVNEIFPLARREDRRRALCLLDPYNLDLSWNLVRTAGQMGSNRALCEFHDYGREYERLAE